MTSADNFRACMAVFSLLGWSSLFTVHYSVWLSHLINNGSYYFSGARYFETGHILAWSVGWFVSLLVRLCEREVLLAGSHEQCSCERASQPSQPAAPSRAERGAIYCLWKRVEHRHRLPRNTCKMRDLLASSFFLLSLHVGRILWH